MDRRPLQEWYFSIINSCCRLDFTQVTLTLIIKNQCVFFLLNSNDLNVVDKKTISYVYIASLILLIL
jgi:hypothetical protein